MDVKLFVLLLIVNWQVWVYAKRLTFFRTRPLYARVRYAKLCADNPEDTGSDNITILYDGVKTAVFAHGFLNRRIEMMEKVIIKIRRCNDAAEDRNCESFQTFRFGREVCSMVEVKDAVWSSIFQAFEPKLHCPLAKSEYRVVNATFDVVRLQKIAQDTGIPLEKYYWRTRLEVYDYKMFTCFDSGIQFLRGKYEGH